MIRYSLTLAYIASGDHINCYHAWESLATDYEKELQCMKYIHTFNIFMCLGIMGTVHLFRVTNVWNMVATSLHSHDYKNKN